MNNYLVSPAGYAISLISGASIGLSMALIEDTNVYRLVMKINSNQSTNQSTNQILERALRYSIGLGMLTSGIYLLCPASLRNLWMR